MTDNKPPDDEGGFSDFFSEISDEFPGIGTARRWYRLAKKFISREYIAKIKELEERQGTLFKALEQQTRTIEEQEGIIRDLRQQLEDQSGDGPSAPAPLPPS